ncbi:MAG TPA: hypothetical protein PLU81_04725 [Deltaproteobacteria bacterium]|nr:hypothetical protein [Deltaproteobacteria bacterium]HPJ94659.1 hypothetical protein [Deltaproteobacteria bacterium]HPR51067.1 hypothetical protein [Deltaproteobacteria bacterium]
MVSRLKRFLSTVILVTMLVSLTSCGYFLYPERRYQQKGELDFPIMILDGSSLLFAAITGQAAIAVIGVVALAVDFTSGSIYLPAKDKKAGLEVFPFDNTKPLTKTDLESILSEYSGSPVHIDTDSIAVVDIGNMDTEGIGEILQGLNAESID